jgi:hypothetical protein
MRITILLRKNSEYRQFDGEWDHEGISRARLDLPDLRGPVCIQPLSTWLPVLDTLLLMAKRLRLFNHAGLVLPINRVTILFARRNSMKRLYPISDDFEAGIQVYSSEEGGLRSPVFNGIR